MIITSRELIFCTIWFLARHLGCWLVLLIVGDMFLVGISYNNGVWLVNSTLRRHTWLSFQLVLSLPEDSFGVIINLPLIVFFAYGKFSKIVSLQKIGFSNGGSLVIVFVYYVIRMLKIEIIYLVFTVYSRGVKLLFSLFLGLFLLLVLFNWSVELAKERVQRPLSLWCCGLRFCFKFCFKGMHEFLRGYLTTLSCS